MSDQLKRNPELEAAIEKEPDNLDTYLVYGDWLQEQGDPRGELIALQCMAHGLPRKQAREYLEPARELLVRHEELLLGGLIGFRYKVKWRLGFIDELRMSGAASTRSGQRLGPAEFLRYFMALPAARFLRRLEIIPGFQAGKAYQPWFVSEELAKNVYPTLETLVLGGQRGEAPPRFSLGPIRLSAESFPRLRSLTVRGAAERFEDLRLPELREFKLFCDCALSHLCQSVTAAHLPKLERLVLHGHVRTDQMGVDKEVQELLDTQDLPHLKHLGLRWVNEAEQGTLSRWNRYLIPRSAEALCRALSRSSLLQRLKSLDLSNNTLREDSGQVLLAHEDNFMLLDSLDLSGNDLSSGSRAKLKKICVRVNTKCKEQPFHAP